MRGAIVDDNPEIRRLLRELLTAEACVAVVAEVDDGDGAAEAVAESGAELVIMDYRMARVDGVEATRRVKIASPSAHVVAFSSAGDDAVAVAFREAGAAAYFDKAEIQELLSYVRSLG